MIDRRSEELACLMREDARIHARHESTHMAEALVGSSFSAVDLQQRMRRSQRRMQEMPTPELLDQIRRLREKGLTYSEISVFLHTTRGRVGGICSRYDIP